MIQSVKDDGSGGYVVILDDGRRLLVPNEPANRHYQAVQDWIALGNTPDPADPPPSPPTDDEIYDMFIKTQRAFKGYVLAVNDGSIIPGSNMTGAQLKSAVKAKM